MTPWGPAATFLPFRLAHQIQAQTAPVPALLTAHDADLVTQPSLQIDKDEKRRSARKPQCTDQTAGGNLAPGSMDGRPQANQTARHLNRAELA